MKKGIRTSFVVFTYLLASLMLIMVFVQGFMVAGAALATFLGMPSFGTLVGIIINCIAMFSGVTLKVAFWLGSVISKSLDSFLLMMFPVPVEPAPAAS